MQRGPRPDTVPAPKTHGRPCLTIERPMLALDNDQLIVRDAERAAACLRLLRGGAGATIRGQAAHPRRGAADCGQYREVTGVGAPPGSAPSERVSLLSPERLDFGRFRFRALVTAAQRGLDLPGIEQRLRTSNESSGRLRSVAVGRLSRNTTTPALAAPRAAISGLASIRCSRMRAGAALTW